MVSFALLARVLVHLYSRAATRASYMISIAWERPRAPVSDSRLLVAGRACKVRLVRSPCPNAPHGTARGPGRVQIARDARDTWSQPAPWATRRRTPRLGVQSVCALACSSWARAARPPAARMLLLLSPSSRSSSIRLPARGVAQACPYLRSSSSPRQGLRVSAGARACRPHVAVASQLQDVSMPAPSGSAATGRDAGREDVNATWNQRLDRSAPPPALQAQHPQHALLLTHFRLCLITRS